MNKVSIIIPCYNCEKTIEKTLHSVLSQTYENIEIITINDGSTDNTLKKIEKFKESIFIFNQENKGQTVTRNIGVKKATGNYLLFLDSDDVIDKTYIEKCVTILDANKNIKVVYSKSLLFGSENGEWELPKFNMKDFLMNNCIHISALHRKEDFAKVDGFDETLTFYEDWDLWIKLIDNDSQVYRIPEYLFHYYKHNDSSSITDKALENKKTLSKNRLNIYVKHIDKYEQNNLSFHSLFTMIANCKNEKEFYCKQYKKYYFKYYSIWYKKYFYKLFNPKKYKKILEHK